MLKDPLCGYNRSGFTAMQFKYRLINIDIESEVVTDTLMLNVLASSSAENEIFFFFTVRGISSTPLNAFIQTCYETKKTVVVVTMNPNTIYKKYATHFILLPNIKVKGVFLDEQAIFHIFIEILVSYISERLLIDGKSDVRPRIMNAPEKASSFGLSLASRLCSIVNDSPATSVETVLAEYLLQHYNMLDTLNIYQFAEACRVPRSSIHRFCGKIGYANFSELKLSCRRETDSYRYFTELSGRHDFRDQLGHEIIHMVSDMNRRISEDLLANWQIRLTKPARFSCWPLIPQFPRSKISSGRWCCVGNWSTLSLRRTLMTN